MFKAAISKASVSLVSFPRCSGLTGEVHFVYTGDLKQNYSQFASLQIYRKLAMRVRDLPEKPDGVAEPGCALPQVWCCLSCCLYHGMLGGRGYA